MEDLIKLCLCWLLLSAANNELLLLSFTFKMLQGLNKKLANLNMQSGISKRG